MVSLPWECSDGGGECALQFLLPCEAKQVVILVDDVALGARGAYDLVCPMMTRALTLSAF